MHQYLPDPWNADSRHRHPLSYPAETPTIGPHTGRLQLGIDGGTAAFERSKEPANCDVVLQFALPDDLDPPSRGEKEIYGADVAGLIGLNLPAPKGTPGLGPVRRLTRVTVPKAAMHEHNGPEPREDEIGASRQITLVQAVSETGGMHRAAHAHLGLGVLSPNGRHDAASDGGDATSGHNEVLGRSRRGGKPSDRETGVDR